MDKGYAVVWDHCLKKLGKKLDKQSFQTWFVPIKPIKLKEDVLTIQVPNKFFYEWIEEKYIHLLKEILTEELGPKGRLEYQILVKKETPNTAVIPDNIKNPFVIPGIKRMKINPNLNPNYTLGNFVEGDCNRLARSAGFAIAKKPGETAFNPLMVYGEVGLGKTHLIQAIGNEIREHQPNKKLIYVTAEEFTNQVIKGIREGSIEDLTQFYQHIDVLIIDDIQFFANKVKTQEIFFHIFNQLHQSRKQLVFTSDKAPKDLSGMEERLLSRFKWGLTADLQKPDFETRMAILEAKLERDRIELPFHIKEYLCYNIDTNVRELEGALISLIANARLNRREFDIDLAREVVEKCVGNREKELNVSSIIDLVAKHYDIDPIQIKGKTRKRNVVVARQLVMYLAKKHTQHSLKRIGEELGKDHSTVIYSVKAIQDYADTDDDFKKELEVLDREMSMTLTAVV